MSRQFVEQRFGQLPFSVVFLALLCGSPASAQLPKGNPKNLGVDSIKTSERQLYGFALNRQADGTLDCAVDRRWLVATYPEYAAELDSQSDKSAQQFKQSRVDRLKLWIKQRNKDEHLRLRLFLEAELERLEAYQPEASKSDFFQISIEPNQLTRLLPAKADSRHVAGVAFKHQLENVTITSASVLERKLKEKGVDPKLESFDLSDRLPKLIRESDSQWAIRQALVEFDVHEPIELQGRGNVLFGVKDRPDALSLLKEMQVPEGLDILRDLTKDLRLDLGNQLEQSEKQQWRQIAIEKAEKKDARGVLILRLEQNPLASEAKVIATFLVKDSGGKWFDLYHREHPNDGSQASKEELDRLKQDPNIQRILPMIEALGGGEQVDRALRYGVATNLALTEARKQFNDYKSPYSRDILSPPPPEPPKK